MSKIVSNDQWCQKVIDNWWWRQKVFDKMRVEMRKTAAGSLVCKPFIQRQRLQRYFDVSKTFWCVEILTVEYKNIFHRKEELCNVGRTEM